MSATTSPEDGVVKVTLNTVYQAQLQTGVDIAEIKGTLLLLTNNITNVIELGRDHEQRIRVLEKDAMTEQERRILEDRITKLETNSISRSGVYSVLAIGLTAAGVLASVVTAIITGR